MLVGLASNVVLYLLYLLLTTAGLGHKTAMTLLFTVGTLQTFLFNKRWSFAHHGLLQACFIKYVVAYGAAYFFNLAALFVFVDCFSLPHQFVQGTMILIIALMLFTAQRYWVFRASTTA